MKKLVKGYKVVLTADRTLMSDYSGGIFLGFSACVPRGLIPDQFYFSLFCPSVGVNGDGSVECAPYGMRKVEAALLNHSFNREEVIVAHPEYLDRVVGSNTKVVGITENDPLGMAPATTTFVQLFGGEAYMEVKFRELLNHPAIKTCKPKIIVGGPGAWQLQDSVIRGKLGIDCVVMGEGERVVGPLFEKAVSGKQLPGVVNGEVVAEDDIPLICGPAIEGIVEIARGCGRGCDFCIPTLQRYRCLSLDHILKEVEINVKAGKRPLLHAEDVLRYKAKGLKINEEAVINLFSSVMDYPGVDKVALSHFTLSSVLSAPDLVKEISNILGAGKNGRWLSGQTGIETGSPKLIKEYMVGKCKPFKPEDWPQVVVDSFKILARNHWVPCATIIMGLPGETEKDVDLTIRLIEELDDFKSMIVPLFLIPEGGLKNSEAFTLDKMTPKHSELFFRCWEHNIDWGVVLMDEWERMCIKRRAARYGLKILFLYAMKQGKKMVRMCRDDYDYDIQAMIRDIKSGKTSATSLFTVLTRIMHPLLRLRRL